MISCCRNAALSHRPQDKVTAEIYGELSTNLFKLEKVCLPGWVSGFFLDSPPV